MKHIKQALDVFTASDSDEPNYREVSLALVLIGDGVYAGRFVKMTFEKKNTNFIKKIASDN